LELPPRPPPWAKVEADWRRLGRYWPGGQPAKVRDRKLLWRLLGLAHWDSSQNSHQTWARAVLEAFCDAASARQVKNPGAYLERLARALYNGPAEGPNGMRPDVRLILRQVETPDWVRQPAERSRSPPVGSTQTPLLDLAERAERAELEAQWRQLMAQVRAGRLPKPASSGPAGQDPAPNSRASAGGTGPMG